MSKHSYFPNSRRNDGPVADRVAGRLSTRLRRLVTEHMKAFKVLVINRRISSGINEADRMENASRNKATLLTNTSTQYEQLPYEAEAADTPCRPVESILMPIEKSHPHENFFVRRESRCCEMAPARTLDGSIRYVRPTERKSYLKRVRTRARD